MKSILIKLFIIGLCVSFFPIQAIAEGPTGPGQIEWLYARSTKENRVLEIRLVDPHENPDECDNAFDLELPTKNNYSSKFTLLRQAAEGGYSVDLWVSGCDSEGQAIVKAVKVLFVEEEPIEQ
jgi:hypothetical protein